MPDFDAWAGTSFPLASWLTIDVGQDVERIVADKPSTITPIRAGATVAAQTVRIEALGAAREVRTDGGQTAMADTAIIGKLGTDLKRGDRFVAGGLAYEVVGLVAGLTNSVQAYAVVRT